MEKNMTKEMWLTCVGPGWRSLVEPLVDYAMSHNLEIAQIKEKFGGLRFYMDQCDETLSRMIDEAENLSEKTCEECGKPATVSAGVGRWYRALCPEHRTIEDEAILEHRAQLQRPKVGKERKG